MSAKRSNKDKSAVLQVFIFRNGQFWGSECFAQDRILAGRSSGVDLELEEDVISRKHVALTVEDDKILIEDLDSANGTYVNGELVRSCHISSLDEVSVGSFTLKFKLLGKRKSKPDSDDKTVVSDGKLVVDDAFTEVVYPPQLAQDQLIVEQKDVPKEPSAKWREQKKSHKKKEKKSEKKFSKAASSIPPLPDEKDALHAPRQLAIEEFPPTLLDKRVESVLEEPPVQPPVPAPASGTRQLRVDPEREPPLVVERNLIEESGAAVKSESQLKGLLEQPRPKLADFIFEQDKPGIAPGLSGDGQALDEEEEQDEEYQKNFVEPFSLLNNLIRENFTKPQIPVDDTPVVEIISYSQDKRVLSYDQIPRGRRYRVGPRKSELARYKRKGTCRIMFNEGFSGGIITGGRTKKVDDLKTAENLVSRRKGKKYAHDLMQGDYANLVHEGGGYFVRFVNPPRLPSPSRNWSVDPFSLKVLGSVFLAHWLLIIILGLFGKEVVAANQGDIDRFAKINIKDIQMEIPEEEPEIPLDQLPEPEEPLIQEEPKQVEKEKPKPQKQKKKPPPKKHRRTAKRTAEPGPGEGGGGGGGGVGMMAALGNLSQRKSSKNIVAAVSNIDAVRSPGGRSRYKLSGVVTKLPTSNVVVSRGHGVGVKAGVDLLRGGKGRGGLAGLGPGAIGGGKAGKRAVGGVVFKAPKRRMTVRGHLSREAIAQVVRQHLSEVQYCYEKNLLLNPNLSGKLVMEWTIATSGSVSVVKTSQSSMKSTAVALCITAKIKQWKFPRPKGGIVVVTYPFIFNSIGF